MNNIIVKAVNVDHITFNSRADAEEILTKLRDIADNYPVVYVSDLYDLIGRHMPGSYTGYYWPSYQVIGTNLYRVREGYIIDLPKATYEFGNKATVTYRDYSSQKAAAKPTPKPLTITIDYAGVDDFDEVLAKVFQYAQTITDREVEINIC